MQFFQQGNWFTYPILLSLSISSKHVHDTYFAVARSIKRVTHRHICFYFNDPFPLVRRYSDKVAAQFPVARTKNVSDSVELYIFSQNSVKTTLQKQRTLIWLAYARLNESARGCFCKCAKDNNSEWMKCSPQWKYSVKGQCWSYSRAVCQTNSPSSHLASSN